MEIKVNLRSFSKNFVILTTYYFWLVLFSLGTNLSLSNHISAVLFYKLSILIPTFLFVPPVVLISDLPLTHTDYYTAYIST